MILNNEEKLYRVNTTDDLNQLKALFVNKVSKIMDKSFEETAVKRMYGYKFEQDSELESLKLRLNPYLVFFENRIPNGSQTLNNGLCVMYPSTLVTGKTEGHVKFVGNSGALLYTLSEHDDKSSYSIDEIIPMFVNIYGGINTKAAIQKMKRIIEMYITDLFLIIE